MRLGSGHLTSPSNKVSWNAARHRLELDRAKLPSRQILTYSLRDERHSGLGREQGWVWEAKNFHYRWWHLTLSRARANWNVVVLSLPSGSRLLSRILWSNTSIPLNVGDTDQGCCITLLVLDEVSSQAGDGEINKKKQTYHIKYLVSM